MLDSIARLKRLERQLDRLLPVQSDRSAWREPGPLQRGELCEWIPQVSTNLRAPLCLSPYTNELEFAFAGGAQLRLVVAAPPQHGKTVVAEHAFPWALLRDPTKRHAYVTYEAGRAGDIALVVQQIAAEAGLYLEGTRRLLRTQHGGSILFTGIGGPLTGYGLDGVLVVDDPIKNRQEADSKVFRERAHQWMRDVAMTRMHPGASVIVMATRWHPDDLSGRLIGEGWRYLNLPAIADEENDPLGRAIGDPLDPQRWPLDFLRTRQAEVGPWTWASLYQGRPRPRGGSIFSEQHYYGSLPAGGYRAGYGLDFAYSAKTQADHSISIEGIYHPPTRTLYVVDVIRKQVPAPQFALALRAQQAKRPAHCWWRAGGTELGVANFIQKHGIPLKTLPTRGDKFTRAQPCAAAWNAGRIQLPDPKVFGDAQWMAPFLDVIQNFTGVHDAHDDDVDALATLWDVLSAGATASGGGAIHDGKPSRTI